MPDLPSYNGRQINGLFCVRKRAKFHGFKFISYRYEWFPSSASLRRDESPLRGSPPMPAPAGNTLYLPAA